MEAIRLFNDTNKSIVTVFCLFMFGELDEIILKSIKKEGKDTLINEKDIKVFSKYIAYGTLRENFVTAEAPSWIKIKLKKNSLEKYNYKHIWISGQLPRAGFKGGSHCSFCLNLINVLEVGCVLVISVHLGQEVA